ncbi:MAG: type IV pilus modification PilV family protein [Brasilonema sp.]
MLKPKLPKTEQGFTLLEVLVSILVATTFVAMSLQAMVLAAYFQVRAKEASEATLLIQQDLENLKYLASTYQHSLLSANTAQNATTITLADTTDFTTSNTLTIQGDETKYTISNKSGNTLTISPALTQPHSSNKAVVNTTRCSNPTQTTGFADGLRDKVLGSDSSATSSTTNSTKTLSATNKNYKLQRIVTPSSSTPFNVLQLSYQVIDEETNPTRTVAEIYTEVIPDAALQCP